MSELSWGSKECNFGKDVLQETKFLEYLSIQDIASIIQKVLHKTSKEVIKTHQLKREQIKISKDCQ